MEKSCEGPDLPDAFREIKKLGIANWVQGRAKRMFLFNSKCVASALWQVERKKLTDLDPAADTGLGGYVGPLFKFYPGWEDIKAEGMLG